MYTEEQQTIFLSIYNLCVCIHNDSTERTSIDDYPCICSQIPCRVDAATRMFDHKVIDDKIIVRFRDPTITSNIKEYWTRLHGNKFMTTSSHDIVNKRFKRLATIVLLCYLGKIFDIQTESLLNNIKDNNSFFFKIKPTFRPWSAWKHEFTFAELYTILTIRVPVQPIVELHFPQPLNLNDDTTTIYQKIERVQSVIIAKRENDLRTIANEVITGDLQSLVEKVAAIINEIVSSTLANVPMAYRKVLKKKIKSVLRSIIDNDQVRIEYDEPIEIL